ncbi:WXG100 family type VII secretion target, partial [Actinomycetospora succinea]|uniref:WXG100 family type VII secretion target n=1 Tax=Actinomycetospora succinea TaxID=663603 RepID=UPI003CD059C8
MPVPGVPWGGRDTSVISHELIHRWIHDGADPAALDSARLRHAARGEELRAAAQRLERAHGQLGASWRGRDAEAAASHVRTLVARMSRLGDAVTGQAGSLQGVRDALARVQSLVGPPRAPALPVLGTSPATPGLAGALATGGPADGFGTFQAAQAEERAAQGAYRAYLDQTGLAARGAPSAVDGLAGRTSVGAAPEVGGTARGAMAGPGGAPGGRGAGAGTPPGRGGVLAGAAAPA